MIRINLSPKKIEKKKENVRVQILIFVLVLTAVIAGCYIAYNQKASEVMALQERVEQKQKNLLSFHEVQKKLKELEAKEKDLQGKIRIIEQIIARRELPIKVLDELSKTLVPEKVWLVDAKAENLILTLNGYAMDNQTIAQYMKLLEASPIFSSVELNLSKQETVAQVKLQKFTITARIGS